MRNSNSQSKTGKGMENQNHLMKTATHSRNSNMENTNQNRPSSGKGLASTTTKHLPPKGPIHKKQYVVEDNMTESRITEAKQGLQLLKKKMSAKGMSRQKLPQTQESKERPVMKKNMTKVEQVEHKQTLQYKMEKKVSDPTSYEYKDPKNAKNKTGKTGSKNIPQTKVYEPETEYVNEEMEAPIQPKKDWDALLEEQLRKQQQAVKKQNKGYNMYDDDEAGDTGQLFQCSMGCGRMFNVNVLPKHEKVCQKVFQSKRKAFNSAAHRAPQAEGFDKPPTNTKNTKVEKQAQTKKEQKVKVPKWKQQSLAFRASMKHAKNVPTTEEQKLEAKKLQQEMDTRVKCDFCGRKFEETAAKRHIPFCETKSKQMPKMAPKKKR